MSVHGHPSGVARNSSRVGGGSSRRYGFEDGGELGGRHDADARFPLDAGQHLFLPKPESAAGAGLGGRADQAVEHRLVEPLSPR
jgi:hypothetical protein